MGTRGIKVRTSFPHQVKGSTRKGPDSERQTFVATPQSYTLRYHITDVPGVLENNVLYARTKHEVVVKLSKTLSKWQIYGCSQKVVKVVLKSSIPLNHLVV